MFVSKIKTQTRGAALVEYGALVALIGIVSISAVIKLGGEVDGAFNGTSSVLEAQGLTTADGGTQGGTTDTPAEPTAPTPPAPTPPNNEYYAVLDGFSTDFVGFDDVGDGEHDVVDMSALVGSMYSTINVEFWSEKELSISDSNTGALLNFTGVEELIVPSSLSPYAMFELNTNGWETDPNFVLITTP